ncbi:MAG: four helix bundle protein [Burkholderiales bacterium]|nr:four helix bundle protein [Burkholderiales bacterium]
MALHTSLPIYKVAYDLLSIAIEVTRNMPRDFKASLGGRIRDECVEVLVLVARANAAREKTGHIDALLEHLHVVEVLLRASKDKRFISLKQYAAAIALTGSVGKQANGWRKHSAASPVA